ncbi:MAG: hypothetical protein KDI13_07515 [Alphaproteobacteria bacterium]|nr:hypothetical protein [Alphaproteobacteria bacterium]
MKKTLILPFVLLLSMFAVQGCSHEIRQSAIFLDGADKYQSQAIAGALSDAIADNLKFYLTESH